MAYELSHGGVWSDGRRDAAWRVAAAAVLLVGLLLAMWPTRVHADGLPGPDSGVTVAR